MNGWEALSSVIGALVLLELFDSGVSRIILALRGKHPNDEDQE